MLWRSKGACLSSSLGMPPHPTFYRLPLNVLNFANWNAAFRLREHESSTSTSQHLLNTDRYSQNYFGMVGGQALGV